MKVNEYRARLGRSHHTGLSALSCSVLLAACQAPAPPVVAPTTTIARPPAAQVAQALPGKRYAVDPQSSEIRLLVYRDGPMARFGHNHVITGRAQGNIGVGASAEESGFRIDFPVGSFEVDPPAARAEEGSEFAATVSDAAREGTRNNMLGADVFDAAAHPLIRVESGSLRGPRWNPEVTARVSLRGATRELKFPAAVFQDGDAVTVVAAFRVVQSDFGLKPFTVLGGAVQVRDTVDVRVRVVARAR